MRDYTVEWESEKSPDADGKYLVVKKVFGRATIDVCYFAVNLKSIDKWDFREKRSGWYDYDSEAGYYEISNIVAWTKLPKVPGV